MYYTSFAKLLNFDGSSQKYTQILRGRHTYPFIHNVYCQSSFSLS